MWMFFIIGGLLIFTSAISFTWFAVGVYPAEKNLWPLGFFVSGILSLIAATMPT